MIILRLRDELWSDPNLFLPPTTKVHLEYSHGLRIPCGPRPLRRCRPYGSVLDLCSQRSSTNVRSPSFHVSCAALDLPRRLIRTSLMLTFACCYLMWAIAYLAQLHPLEGPRISCLFFPQETVLIWPDGVTITSSEGEFWAGTLKGR